MRQADGRYGALADVLRIQDDQIRGAGGRSEDWCQDPAIILCTALRAGHKDGLLAKAVPPGRPALHLGVPPRLRRQRDLQDVLHANFRDEGSGI